MSEDTKILEIKTTDGAVLRIEFVEPKPSPAADGKVIYLPSYLCRSKEPKEPKEMNPK